MSNVLRYKFGFDDFQGAGTMDFALGLFNKLFAAERLRPTYHVRIYRFNPKGTTWLLKVMLPSPDVDGDVCVSGYFKVYVPYGEGGYITVRWAADGEKHFPHYSNMPYRPALLPLDFWKLTPSYLSAADPFNGAADWLPK